MEPEGSLQSSQELSTCTYPEPDQSSPQHSLLTHKLISYNFAPKKKLGRRERAWIKVAVKD
jgi:hypothetical protein